MVVVVRGTDNRVWWNQDWFAPYWGGPIGWVGWSSLQGAMQGAPVLDSDPTACPPTSIGYCNSEIGLVVWGADNAIYYQTFSGYTPQWCCGWDRVGGYVVAQPAFSYGFAYSFILLVAGGGGTVYFNYDYVFTWPHPWASPGGATPSGPPVTYL